MMDLESQGKKQTHLIKENLEEDEGRKKLLKIQSKLTRNEPKDYLVTKVRTCACLWSVKNKMVV